MLRFTLLALVAVACLYLGAIALGRAAGHEIQDRVMFTRDGVTFDCERNFFAEGEPIEYEDGSSVLARAGGEIAYGNCHTLP